MKDSLPLLKRKLLKKRTLKRKIKMKRPTNIKQTKMKRLINLFVAAFAMLAISAGITSCDKDSIAVAKLLGTWKTEKMVVVTTMGGVESSNTITLDTGDDEMFKTLTFTSDGNVVAIFKNGKTDTGTWEYSDGKLILTTEDSGAVSLEFNVDELTRKSLVISMSGSDAKISYHFKK